MVDFTIRILSDDTRITKETSFMINFNFIMKFHVITFFLQVVQTSKSYSYHK